MNTEPHWSIVLIILIEVRRLLPSGGSPDRRGYFRRSGSRLLLACPLFLLICSLVVAAADSFADNRARISKFSSLKRDQGFFGFPGTRLRLPRYPALRPKWLLVFVTSYEGQLFWKCSDSWSNRSHGFITGFSTLSVSSVLWPLLLFQSSLNKPPWFYFSTELFSFYIVKIISYSQTPNSNSLLYIPPSFPLA